MLRALSVRVLPVMRAGGLVRVARVVAVAIAMARSAVRMAGRGFHQRADLGRRQQQRQRDEQRQQRQPPRWPPAIARTCRARFHNRLQVWPLLPTPLFDSTRCRTPPPRSRHLCSSLEPERRFSGWQALKYLGQPCALASASSARLRFWPRSPRSVGSPCVARRRAPAPIPTRPLRARQS